MNLLFIRTITLVPIANAAGGLFDFNGTLPLLVIQFTLLSIILTFLFYKPLSKTLEERETAISYNLRYSSSYLLKASINSILYHEFIAIENKQAQRLISKYKKTCMDLSTLKLIKNVSLKIYYLRGLALTNRLRSLKYYRNTNTQT